MNKNIILFTDSITDAKQEIEGLGGHVTQLFTDSVFVANLPESIDAKSLESSSTKEPKKLDEISKLCASSWKGLQEKSTTEAISKTEGLGWDTPDYEPPHPEDFEDPEGAQLAIAEGVSESTGTPTSLYMTGSIAVGVIIVSGTRNNLKFSSAENQKVIQEVQEGLTFLANVEPKAKITFVYDIRTITVSVAPGATTSYESAEGPWRNASRGI